MRYLRLALLPLLLVACTDQEPIAPDITLAPMFNAAGNSHQLTTTFEGPTTGFITDPLAVAARCPEGFQWILQSAGSGEMVSPGYAGQFTLTTEHCSRWVTGPPDRATGKVVGRIGRGLMTMTTPVGDLTMAYDGTFVFEGDLSISAWVSKVNSSNAIVGGTGVFAGASGHGHIAITDQSGYGSGHHEGSLVYHD